MKGSWNFSLMRLCFILGIASAIAYEYGDENAEKMAALGDRLSKNSSYTFTDDDDKLLDEAIDCYNRMGYIIGLSELY